MSDYVKNESNIIKRAKHSGEEQEAEMDYITKMPESVLTHILTKLTTKEAVQTCILSKGWENSWKGVPNLVASSKHFQKAEFFKRFVSKFLNNRDTEVNLANVDFQHTGYVRTPHVHKIINYALSHDVENLRVNCYTNREMPQFHLFIGSNKLPCNTLKYLDLSFQYSYSTALLPIKMEFPELIECRLRNITFQPMEKENDGEEYCAEPFSGCKKLTTLSIRDCALNKDAKCLVVVGENLTNVTICYQIVSSSTFKVQMKTPNLTSFAYVRPLIRGHDLVFEHNLNFLQEVRMEVCCHQSDYAFFAPSLFKWMKKFTNAHSLTVTTATAKILSEVAGFPNVERLQLSNLRRMTLKFDPRAPCQVPISAINYLLEDSPRAAVKISTGDGGYFYI